MTAADDRDRATRDRMVELLRPAEPWPHAPSPEVIADALLPVVAELVREGQAEALAAASLLAMHYGDAISPQPTVQPTAAGTRTPSWTPGPPSMPSIGASGAWDPATEGAVIATESPLSAPEPVTETATAVATVTETATTTETVTTSPIELPDESEES